MAVFGAVISYFMQMLSFILLRRKLPNIERPYRSPLGVAGRVVAAVIALVALVALFWNDDYRPGVVGVAIFRPRDRLLRDRRAAPARPLAGGGVRRDPGRARPPRDGRATA